VIKKPNVVKPPPKKPEFPLPTETGVYLQIQPEGDERIVQIFRLPAILAFQGIGDSKFFQLDDSYINHEFVKLAEVKYEGNKQKFIFDDDRGQTDKKPDIAPPAPEKPPADGPTDGPKDSPETPPDHSTDPKR